MRIAMISTPFVSVPPPRYGGTELIVAELVRGLAGAGHEVTLFATGDSHAPDGVELRARFDEAMWPPDPYVELEHVAWSFEQLLADSRPYDLVHAHTPSALAFGRLLDAALVYTVHHDNSAEHASLRALYSRSRAQFVAISARQRALFAELADARVIHHGLDPARHPLERGDGGYCAYLGRFAAEKGVHHALDAAALAGLPIRLGGKPHPKDHDYFEEEVAGRLCAPGVTYVGEVGGHYKRALLGGARALLFPIEWEEPFGLVMIEAMLMGTPVLAFPRGSVPEVVDEGLTGFICRDSDEMARRLHQLEGFDRGACRRRALERWTTARMVRDHVAVYEQLQDWVGDVRAETVVA
jgi:glycosyltransferase involved in cell wall biosynthesis